MENRDKQINDLTGELGLGQEHTASISNMANYFQKHRINELFNELMTNIF